jgi:hypothetical protein
LKSGKYFVLKKPFWFIEEAMCINILYTTDIYICYNYDDEEKPRTRDVDDFYDIKMVPASSLLIALI